MERRSAAVAGKFYPDDPRALRIQIDGFLAAADNPGLSPKALIVPHAGTVYSGAIAASAYVNLKALRGQVKRVVLLGPAHYVPISGLAVSSAEYFTTPLGDIPLDRETLSSLDHFEQVECNDKAHQPEHSLELHLPFLQETLSDFKLVPLVVGQCEPEAISEVLEQLWGGPETLIIVSSDLSHYLPYELARKIDAQTTQSIEALRWEEMTHDQACGYYAVRGFLQIARAHHLKVTTLDLRNSGDTAGTKEGVVGYGAYVFTE